MGRRALRRRLGVWMNGWLTGIWEHGPDGESFAYDADWMASSQGRPLSLSLPFRSDALPYRGRVVTDYFDNLLPDSDAIRRRLAQRHRTQGTGPFELLAALGRDCVGALQLLPADAAPEHLRSIDGTPLDEAAIARLLRDATRSVPLGQHDDDSDLRLSIAGAQEKTALLYHEGRWLLPHGSTPTSHILKLPLGLVGNMRADMRTSVENEWLCARLVRHFGLAVADCAIATFEDQKVLAVTRFDRRLAPDGSWIIRLPQEDFCQALGLSPLSKYQADGGPGIADIMAVLAGSETPGHDRRQFFTAQILFWLLAATDGHAKNFSLSIGPGGRYWSTPLYDVLSAYPIMGSGTNQLAPQKARLAMAVRGSQNHYRVAQILRRHWLEQGRRVGLPADEVEAILAGLKDAVAPAIDATASELPAGFPADVAERVFAGLRAQARRI
ncbi:type II toxin-antitoxin system HipA family toxin [Cupriavidus sp. SZY C1]|uniref:type II toxin-antitoxin system HipA family toxin n=1 Tax=Cupriavidus sp. SZY C1 TaxID=3055037 RepID=UPI0028B8D903|nr:type II toxin-antitoxin system HipA family toxin [Cupriavidus sp. SZY C1]MDT6961901.1 type II toxin-antitoxin system HipA family toxin [Cupriavidus sp. SZY C1]